MPALTASPVAPAFTGARAPRPERPLRDRAGGTIRGRLARILALPAVVVLVLLAVLGAEQWQQQRTAQEISRSVGLALSVQNLVRELQNERGITAAVQGGNESFTDELGTARDRVDSQRTAVAKQAAGGSGPQAEVRQALAGLRDLGVQRTAVDNGKAARPATFGFYTSRIAALREVDLDLDHSSDRQLQAGLSTLQAAQDLIEATAQERAFLNGVFSAGGFGPGEFVQFAQMRADREAAEDRFGRFATAPQRASLRFALGTGAARLTGQFEDVAIAAADGRHIVVNPQSWWSGQTTVLDDLEQLERHIGSEIQLRAHDLQVQTVYRIGALAGVLLFCVAGSIFLTVLASRSITRPLAALADEADDVSTARLPDAVHQLQTQAALDQQPDPPAPVRVPDRATSEVRAAAQALDRLQTAAYDLAVEQAQQRQDTIRSMANLGRRNQNLIRRQLGFISSLEREEIDPSALANLFELDHLATRMRRNAASLLVLVGASSPRQWATPVPVADMIRAAVSEVEEYRRVNLRRVDDALVSGSAVGSIAHLLAELIENGLAFSPPDTDLEIQGRRMPDGYLIAIIDQGVGMSASDLATANSRLRGEGDFIANPTRFLGHYVVGRLAQETGVEVQLLPSPVAGITARIQLPGALIVSGPSAIEPKPLTRRAIERSGPDSTPSAGLPVLGRLQPAAIPAGAGAVQHHPPVQHTATERTITERTITERIATERTMTPPVPPVPVLAEPVRSPEPVPITMSVTNPGSLTPSGGLQTAATTQNGLRKRTPRNRNESGAGSGGPGDASTPARGTARPLYPARAPHRPPVVDSSPASVGARITALRSGLQRGTGRTDDDDDRSNASKGSE